MGILFSNTKGKDIEKGEIDLKALVEDMFETM